MEMDKLQKDIMGIFQSRTDWTLIHARIDAYYAGMEDTVRCITPAVSEDGIVIGLRVTGNERVQHNNDPYPHARNRRILMLLRSIGTEFQYSLYNLKRSLETQAFTDFEGWYARKRDVLVIAGNYVNKELDRFVEITPVPWGYWDCIG